MTDDDVRLLDSFRRSFAAAYEEVIVTIRNTVRFAPTGRPAKSTTSIVEKLQRETIRLTQMQDIAGCRLVVPGARAQERVTKALQKALPGVVVVDRRARPSSGYRAVHLVATADAKPIEIQIRTTLQHLWAEFSEKLADVIDPTIKYGGGPTTTRHTLDQYSNLVAQVERIELRSGPRNPPTIIRIKVSLRRLLKEEVARIAKG